MRFGRAMRLIYIPPMLILAAALAGCSPADDREVLRGAEAAALYEELTEDDLAMVEETLQTALESNREGESTVWKNPVSGNSGTIAPGRIFFADREIPCRDYEYRVLVDGREAVTTNSACRGANGTWVWIARKN